MEAEHRLAVAQREVARLRQHIRLDGDTIEDLQDQCGALFVRLNEVAVIAARVPTLEVVPDRRALSDWQRSVAITRRLVRHAGGAVRPAHVGAVHRPRRRSRFL